MNRNLFR